MAPKIDTFAALTKAMHLAGQTALSERGKQVGHPTFTPMALPSESWTCPSCGTVVRCNLTAHEPFAPCMCMAEAAEEVQNAERELLLPDVLEAEWDRAGIPRLFHGSTFENYEHRPGATEALKSAKRYAENFDPRGGEEGLLLYGLPGAGKSRLAAATARAIMEANLLPVVFYTAGDLVEEAKRFRVGSGQTNPIDRAAEAPLLILDDMANQNITPYAQEQIYLVVDRRYRAGLPMIITSNLNDAALRTAMGSAMVSRLLEVCAWVKVAASDYRAERRLQIQRR